MIDEQPTPNARKIADEVDKKGFNDLAKTFKRELENQFPISMRRMLTVDRSKTNERLNGLFARGGIVQGDPNGLRAVVFDDHNRRPPISESAVRELLEIANRGSKSIIETHVDLMDYARELC